MKEREGEERERVGRSERDGRSESVGREGELERGERGGGMRG